MNQKMECAKLGAMRVNIATHSNEPLAMVGLSTLAAPQDSTP
jgi:hypothetical protein